MHLERGRHRHAEGAINAHARRVALLREALTNVMKHSGATQVNVTVRRDSTGLQLEVADNGRGLGADPGHGAGMKSMQSRALRLAGQLHVDSAPGRTVVAITRLTV